MKILLVYPKYPDTFWSFKYALKFISKKASFPPLGLLTVASMVPEETLEYVDSVVIGEAESIWPRFEMIGGMCRFFAGTRAEAVDIHNKIIDWGKFIDFKTSGISIEDITLMWLAKHEKEQEEKLVEERKKIKREEQLEQAKRNRRRK